MSDTTRPIEEIVYRRAETFDAGEIPKTHFSSPKVITVPTSRCDGQVKLRIAPREMPERKTTTTTI